MFNAIPRYSDSTINKLTDAISRDVKKIKNPLQKELNKLKSFRNKSKKLPAVKRRPSARRTKVKIQNMGILYDRVEDEKAGLVQGLIN